MPRRVHATASAGSSNGLLMANVAPAGTTRASPGPISESSSPAVATTRPLQTAHTSSEVMVCGGPDPPAGASISQTSSSLEPLPDEASERKVIPRTSYRVASAYRLWDIDIPLL